MRSAVPTSAPSAPCCGRGRRAPIGLCHVTTLNRNFAIGNCPSWRRNELRSAMKTILGCLVSILFYGDLHAQNSGAVGTESRRTNAPSRRGGEALVSPEVHS